MIIRTFLTIALVTCYTQLSVFGCPSGEEENTVKKPKKYIAFSTDMEAYFMPRDFEHFQGEFTGQIIEVCDKLDVPFTWPLP